MEKLGDDGEKRREEGEKRREEDDEKGGTGGSLYTQIWALLPAPQVGIYGASTIGAEKTVAIL